MSHHRLVLSLTTAALLSLAIVPSKAADPDLLAQARLTFKPLAIGATAAQHPPTPEQIRLGRLLFFETRASVDGTVSCARCHQPALYGTDALPKSIGAAHRTHPRHSQTVLNSAIQFVQHWRGDRVSVEDQAIKALVGPPAYGNPSYDAALAKIKGIRGYGELFARAFPGQAEPVTADNWGTAIGAYVRTLLTPAPFDAFLSGDTSALSAAAQAGLRTFMQVGCAGCHNGVGIGGGMYQKFGVKEDYWTATKSPAVDKGRFDVTQNPADLYVFKVSGLRNVAMTPPYFHDGSVATLPAAVRIMGRVQLGKMLTETEVADIVTFLHTLTGPLPADFATTPALPPGSAM